MPTAPGPRSATIRLLAGIVALCALAVVLPLLSDLYWALELPGHFRAQYAVVTLSATLGLIVLRSWWRAAAGMVVSMFVAVPVAWLWVAPARQAVPTADLDILSLNVSFYQQNQATVRALIDRLDPDVVGLVEVDREWMTKLGSIAESHPHQAIEAAGRRPGVALLSKLPLGSVEVRPMANRQLLVATLVVDDRPVIVGVVHMASPLWERAPPSATSSFRR